MPTRRLAALAVLVCLGALALPVAAKNAMTKHVVLPGKSPLVTFRIVFMTGSAADPAGKEGVAALTASMISDGGSRAMTYDQIVDAMYPMATSFSSQVDKELTVFSGTSHVETLDAYYGLVKQRLLDPGFREDDFKRLKENALTFLKVSLRENNDEELGKEALYNLIYRNHPYGHHNTGRVGSLQSLTLDDVKAFYKANYTRANLMVGLAGGYPKGFEERVDKDFATLPAGKAAKRNVAAPKLANGTEIQIIERETRSTAISFGFPIDVTRSHKDYAALALATTYLGQHRTSISHLYQRLREARGLNYGDYAYIEYFPRGMFQFQPDPNLARSRQIFQIWIRPVEPVNAHFALRCAMFEFDKLVREGMSEDAFEATRQYMMKNAAILTSTQDARLGYAIDSSYYGISEYAPFIRESLSKLKLEDVNRAIRAHFSSKAMRIVIVTKDGKAVKDAIGSNAKSPITYNSPKPADLLEEDKTIEVYPIKVRPEDISIVPVASIFQ